MNNVYEQQNKTFEYPCVFPSNEVWNNEFVMKFQEASADAEMVFETVPADMESYLGGLIRREHEQF